MIAKKTATNSMLFYSPEFIREVIYLWSVGVDDETVSSLMGISPEEVGEIIDKISQHI